MSYESDSNKTSEKNSVLRVAPLFFVIAIDSMGLGILFPILSAMLISHQSHSVSALSFGLTALMTGFAADLSPAAPMYLAFVGLAVAGFILLGAKIKN